MKRLERAFSPRLCLDVLVAASLTLFPLTVAAVQQPRDSIAEIVRVLDRLKAVSGRAAVFPGFRPDTMPYAFVLPGQGVVLVNWPGALPGGFESVLDQPGVGWRPSTALGAASTSTEMGGRTVAQVVVTRMDLRELAPLAVHEAFHVFESAQRADSSYIGQGENSFLVGSYPVFDTLNDARMALEGKLLEHALTAGSVAEARELGQQFVAVRAERHRRLGHSLSEFEQKAEGNEGLAEYALLRTRNALDGLAPGSAPAALLRELRELTAESGRSFRLRYYHTGSAQAFLLDRIDPDWKRRFLSERVFLDELVARASGARMAEQQSRNVAETRERFGTLVTEAERNLMKLRARRLTQIDSILSRPGVLVVIDLAALPNRDIGWCGIDPQNLLQASRRIVVHTRWLRACQGSALDAEFNTPAVQDRAAAELKAVAEPELRITARGQRVTLEEGEAIELNEVRVESRTFNARFTRAELRRNGNVLRITPRI